MPVDSPSPPVKSFDGGCGQVEFMFGRESREERLLDLEREAVSEIGIKQVCFDLDISPSQLAHALAGRDYHYVRAEWLPYLVAKARIAGPKIAKFFCSLCALDAVPRRELTAEEKLERLETSLRKNLGPDLQRVVVDGAFGTED
jgi:hypothetical protein